MRVSKKDLRRIITEELQVVIQEVATQSQAQGQPQSQSEPAFPGAAGIGVTVTEPESKEAVEAEEIATDQQLAQLHGTDPATAAQRNVLNRVRAMLTKKEQALAVAETYSNEYKGTVKISRSELRDIIKESVHEIHLQEGPIDYLRDLLSVDKLKDIVGSVFQKIGISDKSEDMPAKEDEADVTPGEGNIDGMSVSEWLTNYWSVKSNTGHLAGAAIDVGVTDGILSLIKISMSFAHIFVLDETTDPAEKITKTYSKRPGDSPNAHYHIRISDDIPSKSLRNASRILSGDDWDDYIVVRDGVDMDVDHSVIDYLKILASVTKEAMSRSRTRISKPVITSANRAPATQSRIMISNWEKNCGSDGGTDYLINLYGDDEMAAAVGKGLEGFSVKTNENPNDLEVVSIA